MKSTFATRRPSVSSPVRPLLTAPRLRSRARPTEALPGVIGARERQEAARQEAARRALADRVKKASRDLNQLIQQISVIGNGGQPIIPGRSVRTTAGEHWTRGLNLRYEADRVWRSNDGLVFRGQRDEFLRKLLNKLPQKNYALKAAVRDMDSGMSGMGDISAPSGSNAMLLALGLAAGYFFFAR